MMQRGWAEYWRNWNVWMCCVSKFEVELVLKIEKPMPGISKVVFLLSQERHIYVFPVDFKVIAVC